MPFADVNGQRIRFEAPLGRERLRDRRQEIEQQTLDYMATMPAWQDHPRVARRPSQANDGDGYRDTQAVSHVVPGTAALEALRLGVKARRAREANSSAFM